MISTKHKKATGIVLKVLEDAVIVEGVNVLKRAQKGKGYVEKTHPIHISNVMYYDTETQQASKISIVEVDGKRKRKIVKTNRILDK